jgi:dihydroflavonol-4-reductase
MGWSAELLARLQGKSALFTRARARSVIGRYAFYDASRARQELGYTSRPVRETLVETVQWVRAQGWV